MRPTAAPTAEPAAAAAAAQVGARFDFRVSSSHAPPPPLSSHHPLISAHALGSECHLLPQRVMSAANVASSAHAASSTTSGARKPTVLVTGCSSGIGRATALLFAVRGWRVAAAFRLPHSEPATSLKPRVAHIVQLDLCSATSITRAVRSAINALGGLDAVVMCAGRALVGPLEDCTFAQWTQALAVNVAGPLALVGAALPHLRTSTRTGTAVLVSSALGSAPLPLTAPYVACKAAVDAAVLGAAAELKKVGVRIKVVLPGRVTGTHFIDNAERTGNDAEDSVYGTMTERALLAMQEDDAEAKCSTADQVAEQLWQAVTDDVDRIRYVVGADAKALLHIKSLMSDEQLRDELITRFALS